MTSKTPMITHKAYFDVCEPLEEVAAELGVKPCEIAKKRSIIGRMVSTFVTKNYPRVVKKSIFKVINSDERPVLAYPARLWRPIRHYIKHTLMQKYFNYDRNQFNDSDDETDPEDNLDNDGNLPGPPPKPLSVENMNPPLFSDDEE